MQLHCGKTLAQVLPSLPELFARSKAAAINLGADVVIFRLVLRVFAGNVQCFR